MLVEACAVFVGVGFVVLGRAFGIFSRPRDVAAISAQALRDLRDADTPDHAKELAMRRHSFALGRLFLRIAGGAVVAAGAPLAVVWVLDAEELISFDEVLAALLSVRVILAATAILGVAAWVERQRRGGARDGAH